MAVEDLIGAPVPPTRVVVERGPVAAFATAVKDDDPVYRDPRAAEAAGFDAIPVPPTFSFALPFWGAFPELQPDGADRPNPMMQAIGELMSDGGLILHGGQEFTYHRPLVVGDVLTAHGAVKDIYAKEGSGGSAMTFVVTETEWRDDAGEPVVTSTMTLIHRR